MTGKKFDVLVAGELNVDLIMNRLDRFPVIGKEILAGQMLLTLGSSSAIFASNLAALGARVSFCGRIGQDAFGDKILADLTAARVDCGNITQSRTADTGITVALNVGQDRAMVTYPGAMTELSVADISDDMLDSAAHLHVSSVFLQPALKPGLRTLFRRARQRGLTTSLDPQWDPAETWDCGLASLLPYVSVFLPNEKELECLTGCVTWESAVAHIRDLAELVVVKRGSEGAVLCLGDNRLIQPAFLNQDVADAIGAGDSFNAGFIRRFVQGAPALECLEYGALCGAINTTGHGGTAAFRDMEAARGLAQTRFARVL